MKALIVLPQEPMQRVTLERVIHNIGYLPRGFTTIDLAAPEGLVDHYSRELPAHRATLYRPGGSETGYDAVFYMPGAPRPRKTARRTGTTRTYSVMPWGEVNREGPADEFDYPFFDTHVFNRLGPRAPQFHFFPYVYTELRPGLGPTNEYGYRISTDLAVLERRPPNHKVVAVFGGSSTWSIFAQYDEMFTRVLEDLLNQDKTMRFTVLNFGMAAAPIFHEMISYLIFCDEIRPDIVIAHDGFNDLSNGQHTDPFLLNRAHLTYYPKLELWAQMLGEGGRDDMSKAVAAGFWQGGPTPAGDHPRAIMSAYIHRRSQFARVVHANGGIFVSGLQPILASKRDPSPWEASWQERHGSYGPLATIFANVPYLYTKLLEAGEPADMLFANVHEHFARFGGDVTLFEDFAHTRPSGDRAIAEYYDRYLRENAIPRLRPSPVAASTAK